MGRAPCCEKIGLNRGPWTREEDLRLIQYIKFHGEGCWRTLPKAAGLLRCGKSCRLRWINYLRPDLKRGNITEEEDRIIIKLHATLGNRWSLIAARLPGRTDNEIKNYWNTHLKKKLRNMGLDPQTHQPLQAAASSSTSHREMFKVDAGVVYEGSMKGRNADSTEELYCREKLFSSSCKLSDVDQKITPSISRINSSVTANCSSSSDIRGKSIDISQVKQELAPEFQATSITNRAAIRSDLYNSDTVDTGPAVISSTTGRAVNCNSNTTNSENRISVDNDPSGFDLHLFSNISSSNALLSLIDNELFWDTQIINMDQQHPRFEEELEAAAADWPHALNELVSSDLWNF